jgi:hypothetical protein
MPGAGHWSKCSGRCAPAGPRDARAVPSASRRAAPPEPRRTQGRPSEQSPDCHWALRGEGSVRSACEPGTKDPNPALVASSTFQ